MQLSADSADEVEEERIKIGWVIVASYGTILLIHLFLLFYDIFSSLF
jgi:hypothetical protein